MKLVIDYIGSKSINGVTSHGGANYTKKVLVELSRNIREDITIIVIWPKGYEPVDTIEKNIYNNDKNFKIIELDEIDSSLGLSKGDVVFFPLLRTRRYPILKKVRELYPEVSLYLTNHDVRPLDQKPDEYSKYYTDRYFYLYEIIKFFIRAQVYKIYIRRYYKYLDKLFTVSNDALQKIVDITCVKQINYFYEETLISNNPIINCIDDNYILFVSGKVSTKNFARALEAFCRYKEITHNNTYLYVTGMSDEVYRYLLRNKKLNLEIVNKWVKTFEYVDIQMLNDLYAQCEYLLYPSLNEGFGLPILEAATCGKRTLASYVSAIPEILGGVGYYVNPYSVEDITRGMLQMDKGKVTDDLFMEKVKNNLRNSEIDMAMLIKELLT